MVNATILEVLPALEALTHTCLPYFENILLNHWCQGRGQSNIMIINNKVYLICVLRLIFLSFFFFAFDLPIFKGSLLAYLQCTWISFLGSFIKIQSFNSNQAIQHDQKILNKRFTRRLATLGSILQIANSFSTPGKPR